MYITEKMFIIHSLYTYYELIDDNLTHMRYIDEL